MVVSNDKYELPLFVADSMSELAAQFGVSRQYVAQWLDVEPVHSAKHKYVSVDVGRLNVNKL